MMCNNNNTDIIITIIFSLSFPHYYHCTYYTTTIHINITLTTIRMIVMIMKMMVMTLKNFKQTCEKKTKQIKLYKFYQFSFGPRTEGRTGLTNRQKC